MVGSAVHYVRDRNLSGALPFYAFPGLYRDRPGSIPDCQFILEFAEINDEKMTCERSTFKAGLTPYVIQDISGS